jgi:hypothetical protein
VGNVTFKSLTDFTRHNANLACTCGSCRHRGVVDRDKVAKFYHLHVWPTALEVLHLHMKCHRCGGRPVQIRATWEPPTFPNWMASEDRWRQLYRRLRD